MYLWKARTDSWVFVNLPEELSDDILASLTEPPRGFGSVWVEVRVGATTWRTSVFPSKELKTFVLPVKRAVLRAESLTVGGDVRVRLRVL